MSINPPFYQYQRATRKRDWFNSSSRLKPEQPQTFLGSEQLTPTKFNINKNMPTNTEQSSIKPKFKEVSMIDAKSESSLLLHLRRKEK